MNNFPGLTKVEPQFLVTKVKEEKERAAVCVTAWQNTTGSPAHSKNQMLAFVYIH